MEDGPVIGRDIFVPPQEPRADDDVHRIVHRTGPARPHVARAAGRSKAEAVLAWRPLRIIGLCVGALLLAALLNADHLLDRAEKKPFGSERDFWVGVWQPVAAVSDALLLNKPRELLDRMTGRELKNTVKDPFATGPGVKTPDVTEATPDSANGGEQTPPAGATASATPAGSTTATATKPAATPGAAPAGVRAPTADNPLRMWIGGDSLAVGFGASLARVAGDTGLINPTVDAKAATGLTRPDFFSWPEKLTGIVNDDKPDLMVIIFGANDSQGMQTTDGKVYQPLTDGWRTEYRRRVGAIMDLIIAPNRMVIWVGLPIMQSADFSERMADLNAIYKSEAAKRKGIVFVDTWALFADSNGKYSDYLPDDSGTQQLMRAADGIHLSIAGASRMAEALMAEVTKAVPSIRR